MQSSSETLVPSEYIERAGGHTNVQTSGFAFPLASARTLRTFDWLPPRQQNICDRPCHDTLSILCNESIFNFEVVSIRHLDNELEWILDFRYSSPASFANPLTRGKIIPET